MNVQLQPADSFLFRPLVRFLSEYLVIYHSYAYRALSEKSCQGETIIHPSKMCHIPIKNVKNDAVLIAKMVYLFWLVQWPKIVILEKGVLKNYWCISCHA